LKRRGYGPRVQNPQGPKEDPKATEALKGMFKKAKEDQKRPPLDFVKRPDGVWEMVA
jgi:hypothetical protein